MDELVVVARLVPVTGITYGPQPIAGFYPIAHIEAGRVGLHVRVEPVPSIVAPDADAPTRVEEPPDFLDAAPEDRAYRSSGFGEDVVAFVYPDLAPTPVDVSHPRRMPVVPEVDDRIPRRTSDGENHPGKPFRGFVAAPDHTRVGRRRDH